MCARYLGNSQGSFFISGFLFDAKFKLRKLFTGQLYFSNLPLMSNRILLTIRCIISMLAAEL